MTNDQTSRAASRPNHQAPPTSRPANRVLLNRLPAVLACSFLLTSCASTTEPGQTRPENPFSQVPENLLRTPLPPVPLTPQDASPVDADRLIDVHQENATRASEARRQLTRLIELIRRLQKDPSPPG